MALYEIKAVDFVTKEEVTFLLSGDYTIIDKMIADYIDDYNLINAEVIKASGTCEFCGETVISCGDRCLERIYSK